MNEENISPPQEISGGPTIQPQSGFAPLEIGGLFKRTWQIYKSRFWTFLGIMMALMVLRVIWLIGGSAALVFFRMPNYPYLYYLLLLLVASLVFGLFGAWGTAALLYAIKEREEKIRPIRSFRKAWSKLLSFIWVSFLVSLCVAGGTLLLIIPGIIFAVWFLFASYVVVSEDIKGTNALSRSKELVKGYGEKVFIRMLLIGFLSFVTTYVIDLIPWAGGYLAGILVLPFYTTFLFLVYEDLRRIKSEGAQNLNRSI